MRSGPSERYQGDPAASAAHLLAGADADRWNIAAGLGWVQGEPGLASPAVQPLQLQFLGAQVYPPAVLAFWRRPSGVDLVSIFLVGLALRRNLRSWPSWPVTVAWFFCSLG